MRRGWTLALAAFESLLLAGLLLFSASILWRSLGPVSPDGTLWPAEITRRVPGYGSSELLLAVALSVGCYWLLQSIGRNRAAFWIAAFLVLAPLAPPLLSHNRLEWYRFFGVEASFAAGMPPAWSAAALLACLAGLVVLYRAIALRKLEQLLTVRRIDRPDRGRVVLGEALMVAGLIAASLALTALVIVVGRALGGPDGSLGRLPWTVLTVGGGATVLLALFVILWFRNRDAG